MISGQNIFYVSLRAWSSECVGCYTSAYAIVYPWGNRYINGEKYTQLGVSGWDAAKAINR